MTIVYPLFMNHIITGDERNVKNLEMKVYVSWGMSFNDGQISSQKVNLQHTLLSAGNEVKQRADNQNGEFEAAHCRPPRKSPLYLRGWYKGLSFGL